MCTKTPDDLGGYVRIHEGAELIRPGAPLCPTFGCSGRPGIYPYGTHLRDLTPDPRGAGTARPTRSRLACLPPARSTAPLDA